jgi:hypothetical protein
MFPLDQDFAPRHRELAEATAQLRLCTYSHSRNHSFIFQLMTKAVATCPSAVFLTTTASAPTPHLYSRFQELPKIYFEQ